MSQLTADRIRLAIDQTATQALLDIFSAAAPSFANGADLRFEVGFFLNGATLDLSNVSSVRLQIKPSDNRDALALLDRVVASGALNQAMTLDQWNSGDPAQWNALFTFPATDTVLDMEGQDSRTLWLVMSALLTDGSTAPIATGLCNVVDTGFNTATPSTISTPTYYTAAQSDARYTIDSTKVSKTGDTMSGPLIFSGSTNAGLKLNNLTTTQRNALTGAAGMLVYDTTVGGAFLYEAAWKQLVTSVNTKTGDVTLATDDVAEGSTNKYFTIARTIAATLTAYSEAGGYSTITSSDTVLTALQKLGAKAALAGGGSVTSVDLSMPALFAVSGNPITTSGTLAVTLAQQAANQGWFGPTSGGSANPIFRALVSADIPTLAQSKITSLTTDLAARLQLAGGTMTGPITLLTAANESGIASPAQGMIMYDTSTNAPVFYNGAAWVAVAPSSGGSYVAKSGDTMSGALNLVSGTPSGQNATSFAYTNATYMKLAGGTFTGSINFSTGLSVTIPNVTTTQRNALTPANGMMVFDSNDLQPYIYNGSFWQSPLSAAGAVLISGSTMTGKLDFSGTTHPGIRLNNLTATQMNALTPTAGMLIYNTTSTAPYYYTGAAWVGLLSGSSFVPTGGGTMTGNLDFSGSTFAGITLNNLTRTEIDALTGVTGQTVWNLTTGQPVVFNGTEWCGWGGGGISAPNITPGSAAGSLATATTAGDPNPTTYSFRVTLTTGASGLTTGSLFTVAYANTIALNPKIVWSCDIGTADNQKMYVDFGTYSGSGFTFKCKTALTAGTTYNIDFILVS